MIRTGILTADDPVELLDGCLVQKMPKNPVHCFVTDSLRDFLLSVMRVGWLLRCQEPVTLKNSEPEPDLCLVRGRRADFASRHPGVAEILPLIEISDTTLTRDRGSKKIAYAKAGIGEYWIVNLTDKQIEVYRDPDTAAGEYPQPTVYGPDQDVPVVIDGTTIGAVRLAALLPS
jgi:Uma2 family endonuclease